MKFKTNINCGSCVRAVSSFLDNMAGLKEWSVDTDDADKILTIKGEIEESKVVEIVKEAGFDIEKA